MLSPALLLAVSLAATPAPSSASGVSLEETASHRKVNLTGGALLETDFQPSFHSELRLTDDLRLLHGENAPALDNGGGVSSDIRQILALILGFIPGFGLGHLVAHDKSGFILFLVIDVVLWFVGGAFWFAWHGWWLGPFGGVIWLVVHIIQALDAYGSAGGEKLIMQTREKAVRFANSDEGSPVQPAILTRVLKFDF